LSSVAVHPPPVARLKSVGACAFDDWLIRLELLCRVSLFNRLVYAEVVLPLLGLTSVIKGVKKQIKVLFLSYGHLIGPRNYFIDFEFKRYPLHSVALQLRRGCDPLFIWRLLVRGKLLPFN
jgi:hypothetical protein